jgi:hypothetical protein
VALELVGPFTECHVDTTKFVTHVLAVIFSVTLPAAVDTGPICALELIRAAGGHGAVLLIGFVFAVGAAVTAPADVYTFSTVTVELK